MKTLILLITVINLSFSMQHANANSAYCEWIGSTATIIAENRDNGLSELDLIENYLNQNQSYQEQTVILPLIERVYTNNRNTSPGEIAIVEQQHCELA